MPKESPGNHTNTNQHSKANDIQIKTSPLYFFPSGNEIRIKHQTISCTNPQIQIRSNLNSRSAIKLKSDNTIQ